ncbi:ATP-binding protein [Algoriphagus formosus]|uniref:ATP-binding protein n=1 Tax=Algoriphagus formosus TaxID=2007308 RepID=UPI000C28DF46|nr:ATP-binding protein [Algoriphagus formosus]
MRKEKEQSLNQAYQEFIEIGLNIRPIIDELKHLIDPKIMGFGTTEDERIFSRQEFIDLIKRQEEQAVGIKLEHEVKPIHRRVLSGENSAIYVDDLIMRITTDSGQFEMKMRFSMILEYQEKKWIVVHWHGSKPEEVKSEEDTWGIDIWKKKTEELEQIVSEKTADLVEKNRELEIEAALERVRAVAMGMKKPEDMLSICRIISEQLQNFGVTQIRNIQTAIIDEEKGIYLCYQYFTPYDQEAVERTEYLKSPVEHGMVRQMLASKDGHFTGTLAGKELDEFREHRKAEDHFSDPLLDGSDEISYCFLSIGEGGLGLTIYQSLDKQTLVLFKRFHQVFSLAYQRFRDIQKAEARAREVEIDLALERVRAQTMAMHSSEDVGKSVVKMFAELTALGVDEGTRFGIGILNHENEKNQLWTARKHGDEVKMHIGNIDMASHPLLKSAREAWKAQISFHKYVLEGDDLLAYYRMLNTAPDYKIQIPIEKLPQKEIQHCFIFEHGFFYAFTPHEFDSELIQITKRFSTLFEQTYRRYLDLVTAEAQAREAKIEAALEKVRSRSLAMHNSIELNEVIQVVYDQLLELNLDVDHAGFIIDYKDREDMHIWLADHQQGVPSEITIPYFDSPHWNSFLEAKAKGDHFFANLLPFEVKNKFYQDLFQYIPEMTKEAQKVILSKPALAISTVLLDNVGLYIEHYSEKPFKTEENEILMRFGKVFQQTYTRFLDLKKAEAQARESDIQLALERVRARTMAMQHSDELTEASEVLDQQVRALGIDTWGCAFHIYADDPEGDYEWFSSKAGTLPFYKTPRENFFLKFYEKGKAGETFHVEEFLGEACKDHYEYIMTIPVMGDALREVVASGGSLPESQYDHIAFFKHGFLLFITYQPVPEAHDVFQRFSKVFEQTYTRFLDLQKAEAQAREAQIQLALERVRAKTMAMKSQSDLLGIIEVFGQQLSEVNVRFTDVTFIEGPITKNRDWELWSYIPGTNNFTHKVNIPYLDISYFTKTAESVEDYEKTGKSIQTKFFTKEEKDEFLDHYWKYAPGVPEKVKDLVYANPGSTIVDAFLENVTVSIVRWDLEPFTEEDLSIFERFAKEFKQTYTRYLDIKKAEAQAREAKIEVALEKVRSRTMGMQKAEELGDVATLLFNELNTLVDNLWTCGFVLCEKDRQEDEWWLSADNGLIDPFFLPNIGDYAHESLYEGWKKGESYRTVTLEGPQLQEHYDWLLQIPIAAQIFEEMEGSGIPRPTWQRLHAAYFKTGYLVIITEVPCGEEDIFKRFAQVFDLTYTRFLDLKKAENQAREAQIEAALEKVRSRSLAMQDPEELTEVAQLLREEMGILGVEELETSSIYIHEESNGLTQCWFTIKNSHIPARSVSDQMVLDLQDTWVGNQMLRFYRSKEKKTSILMKGEQRVEWIRYCESKSELLGKSKFYGETIPERTYHLYKFSDGFLGAASSGPISAESWDLMRRATAVFSFAFTRFLDLQRAQASAKEARRQASLDRVRADISSMRTAADLDKITPLLFKELTTLDIPFIRCGVFIINEKAKIVEAYLSSPEGKSLGVLHLPFDASELTFQTVEAWRKGEVYRQHWDKEDFLNWIQQIMEKDLIQDEKTYQGTAAPPKSLNLHFVPFTQGMLYVGSTEPLSEDEIDLIRSLSEAFAIAYSRYEDFVKLEKAKAEIESAMSELKATQTQLVQQEKLASLGQLTAGIAHEIKNPLNFVNNFSEVSNELIDEAFEELEKLVDSEEKEEIIAILEDVKGNLSKVQEHGKRANGIVTSMLQHSRGGDGKIEPTDLNALLKEYVNLSFHGMRAGKNPINVDIDLQLEDGIGKVNLISEDFSRVIVNLCNNAFDAMRQKRVEVPDSYQPKLTVRTKSEKNQVFIEVEDNGPGIPDEIKDKILQPFFTTKKGTEGTGLGLSITNDIIKAHGGSLEVESNQDGSKFVISLPQ